LWRGDPEDSPTLYILPAFLPKLLETHPTLEFEVVHAASNRITDGVLNGRIDFGLVANPFRQSDLVIQHICWELFAERRNQ
jgi:DNA-binding transcriptional LysR family regulator